MKTCRWMKRVERVLDGAGEDAAAGAHVLECPICAAFKARIERWRAGVAAVRRAERIEDAQFPAFMAGIREEISTTRPRRRGLWAMTSLAAAALLLAVAGWTVMRVGFEHPATEVEAMSTELKGASLDYAYSEDGVPTLWVNVSKDDMW